MDGSNWLIIALVLLFIVGGLGFIYKSARKFHLSKDQLKRIKERNAKLDAEEESER